MSAAEEALNSQEFTQQDEFSALAKLLDDFSGLVAGQKKLKHCFMQKDDLIAVISTFKQAVLNAQVEYFYSYQAQATQQECFTPKKNLKVLPKYWNVTPIFL